MNPDPLKKAHDDARIDRAINEDTIHNRALKLGRELMREAANADTDTLTKTMLALVWGASYHAGALFQDESHAMTRKLLVDAVDTGLAKGKTFREKLLRGEDPDE